MLISFTLLLITLNGYYMQTNLIDQTLSCTRKCDSHFSGSACWSQTFNFFTNDLFKSISYYGNVAYAAIGSSNYTSVQLYNILNDTINSYNDTEQEVNSGLAQIGQPIINGPGPGDILNQIFNRLDLNSTKNFKLSSTYIPQCPQQCNQAQINTLIILFGVFCGLTLLTILAVILYTLYLKFKYYRVYESLKKKYDQK